MPNKEKAIEISPKSNQASGDKLANNTKIVDTMGTKIKDTVVLVCLGDSRGFVHMNHLILK